MRKKIQLTTKYQGARAKLRVTQPSGQGQGQQKRPRPGLARPLVSVVTMDKMIYEILYHFNQFVSHASHLFFFFDHGFKFFFNLPDFLRSFENLKSHVTDELIKMAQ